jgi:hypothetical protein
MNSTSTNMPLWKDECEKFRTLCEPFAVRNAQTIEHMAFVQAFCMAYEWTVKQRADTVVFSPPPKV